VRGDARRTLVAYDVPDDKRRSRIARTLEAYGHRLQFSVFVVEIGPIKLARLRRELSALIAAEDSVLLCDLGPAHTADDRCEFLGRTRVPGLRPDLVV